ncbi:MAG: DUF1385 domain-containing protein [Nitrospirae bacterium]|nr:DUF1385 domain-containing protein [Nitrospirota bacterium]
MMKNIGGQAVIEGVMMKSSKGWSVAVRDPKGAIHHKTVELKPLHKFFKLPVIRGFIALLHALIIGIKAIEFSGNIALAEDEKPMSGWSITFSILTALLLAVGLFIVLPLYATKLLGDIYGSVAESSILFNLVDGILRVAVFLGYVTAIGLWKEMRRLYQYHGAEHKTIYAYEAGEELTVEAARKYKPYHPRCGTSFLLIVMVISILVFSFIPQSWSFVLKFGARLVLIPLIAGVSYEALKLSAKKGDNFLMKMISVPGMFLQRLTAREPDDSQIEVAIAALKEVLALEKGKEASNNA